ncbi:M20/M25/M40 family metallo-hydrolase [Falsiroseomonas sp.]|uniref:M20/M25/M40 family metallo-hydrolase n=1 Tax=Falsiroseomonas sp. TaxID=2870721 RepID=UPI0027289996|nr:M20/M25/M40 family metallo-hydrolase [Falsiroseomonas sp.]MDO9500732.1 M20/M25/M40 family metallo-hydrolase [Falsiroseomonas sp.]MDP3417041.1 M20/M25/M40 family metallo-hydrolase [Falsiroseomonas sp.]
MTLNDPVLRLAADLIAIDSRSSLSNLAVAERIEQELSGFEVERLDYTDANGVPKRALVAHKGPKGGYALSGHMDTVPATGWESDPWAPRLDEAGMLHGLGSVDMKGQVAAAIIAARQAPADVPATLLITTDEETTKAGARRIARDSALAKSLNLQGIFVVEPTGLVPVRGHRSHIAFTATAHGVQAHSSTGKGTNANWKLLPFLVAMRAVHDELRTNPALQDADYDPPFSDFNLILDNHGTAMNVTVAKATAQIKFRYSAKVDPKPILHAVRQAARDAGIDLTEQMEGFPPELPADHPFVARATRLTNHAPRTAPYGTDASELQVLAPCVVLGPGDIAMAHTPRECVRAQDLLDAVPVFGRALAGQ